jgi:hypothetical protein
MSRLQYLTTKPFSPKQVGVGHAFSIYAYEFMI